MVQGIGFDRPRQLGYTQGKLKDRSGPNKTSQPQLTGVLCNRTLILCVTSDCYASGWPVRDSGPLKIWHAQVDISGGPGWNAFTLHLAFERRHTVLLLPRHVSSTASIKPWRGSRAQVSGVGLNSEDGPPKAGHEAVDSVYSRRFQAGRCAATHPSGRAAAGSSVRRAGSLSMQDASRPGALIKIMMAGQSSLGKHRRPARQRELFSLCFPTVLTPRRDQQAGRIQFEGVY